MAAFPAGGYATRRCAAMSDWFGESNSLASFEDGLLHFDGLISIDGRIRLCHALQEVEQGLELPSVPANGGAVWIVVAHGTGHVFATRHGISHTFIGDSVDILISALDRYKCI